MATHPKLKLTYFNSPGRAEPIRLALAIGGIAFEDVRLTREEFGQQKAEGKFIFGQVPVLEVDGVQFAQSNALLTYVGKLAGLYPSDAHAGIHVDEAVGLFGDLQAKVIPIFICQDPEAKAKLAKDFFENVAPVWLGFAEAHLAKNGTGYFAGNALSIADIVWEGILRKLGSGWLGSPAPEGFADKFPLLQKHGETLASLPAVVAWNEAHKQ